MIRCISTLGAHMVLLKFALVALYFTGPCGKRSVPPTRRDSPPTILRTLLIYIQVKLGHSAAQLYLFLLYKFVLCDEITRALRSTACYKITNYLSEMVWHLKMAFACWRLLTRLHNCKQRLSELLGYPSFFFSFGNADKFQI
jgi:hypothetical protein